MLSACRSAPPKVDVALWAGDSEKAGVTRAQVGETISCADPKIDAMVCMTYADLKKFLDTMWQCKRWASQAPKMNRVEMLEALEVYTLIAQKADQK